MKFGWPLFMFSPPVKKPKKIPYDDAIWEMAFRNILSRYIRKESIKKFTKTSSLL